MPRFDLLVPLLASTIVAVAGWVITHLFTRHRDRVNKRRDQRIQFLVDAYRRLERASERDPRNAHEYDSDIESAIADIQLLGTPPQVEGARAFAQEFARQGGASLVSLLEGLRADLRQELRLGPVSATLLQLRIVRGNKHDSPPRNDSGKRRGQRSSRHETAE